jgi:hypothetical protein
MDSSPSYFLLSICDEQLGEFTVSGLGSFNYLRSERGDSGRMVGHSKVGQQRKSGDEATFESSSLFSRRVRDRDFQHSFPLPGTVQMKGQKNG